MIHQIARRAIEAYSSTGAENCSGMLRNLSMSWTTPEEEKQFEETFTEVYGYTTYIDSLIGISAPPDYKAVRFPQLVRDPQQPL